MLDIEMQMEDEKDIDERATSYMGKLISEQLQVGHKYTELKKSIVIFITNYNFLKRNSYHSVGRLKFEKTLKEEYVELGYEEEDEIASEYIEYHYIELPKYKNKNPKDFTKLDQWMCIFTQNEGGIMLAKKENKEIERAINTLDFISEDPKERERHNSIVMAEYNRLTSQHNFYKAGLQDGIKEIAKELLKIKMPIEQIMQITGPNGKTANVLTAWIKDNDNAEPRLTSIYVDKR